MRNLAFMLTITLGLTFAPVCNAQKNAQNNAQTKLTQIGNLMVGSWTPAGQSTDGPRKHVYEWVLDKKFLRTNGELDPNPWHGYMGIDLKNDKVGWWGFFADGTSGVLYLTKFSTTEWVFEGDDFGPDGKFHRTVTITDPIDGKLHSKIEDRTAGKTEVVQEQDWVRHRK